MRNRNQSVINLKHNQFTSHTDLKHIFNFLTFGKNEETLFYESDAIPMAKSI